MGNSQIPLPPEVRLSNKTGIEDSFGAINKKNLPPEHSINNRNEHPGDSLSDTINYFKTKLDNNTRDALSQITSIYESKVYHYGRVYIQDIIDKKGGWLQNGESSSSNGGGWESFWVELRGCVLTLWKSSRVKNSNNVRHISSPSRSAEYLQREGLINAANEEYIQIYPDPRSISGIKMMANRILYVDISHATLGMLRSNSKNYFVPLGYNHVFGIRIEGGNLLLFACPTSFSLKYWVSAIRLSQFELYRVGRRISELVMNSETTEEKLDKTEETKSKKLRFMVLSPFEKDWRACLSIKYECNSKFREFHKLISKSWFANKQEKQATSESGRLTFKFHNEISPYPELDIFGLYGGIILRKQVELPIEGLLTSGVVLKARKKTTIITLLLMHNTNDIIDFSDIVFGEKKQHPKTRDHNVNKFNFEYSQSPQVLKTPSNLMLSAFSTRELMITYKKLYEKVRFESHDVVKELSEYNTQEIPRSHNSCSQISLSDLSSEEQLACPEPFGVLYLSVSEVLSVSLDKFFFRHSELPELCALLEQKREALRLGMINSWRTSINKIEENYKLFEMEEIENRLVSNSSSEIVDPEIILARDLVILNNIETNSGCITKQHLPASGTSGLIHTNPGCSMGKEVRNDHSKVRYSITPTLAKTCAINSMYMSPTTPSGSRQAPHPVSCVHPRVYESPNVCKKKVLSSMPGALKVKLHPSHEGDLHPTRNLSTSAQHKSLCLEKKFNYQCISAPAGSLPSPPKLRGVVQRALHTPQDSHSYATPSQSSSGSSSAFVDHCTRNTTPFSVLSLPGSPSDSKSTLVLPILIKDKDNDWVCKFQSFDAQQMSDYKRKVWKSIKGLEETMRGTMSPREQKKETEEGSEKSSKKRSEKSSVPRTVKPRTKKSLVKQKSSSGNSGCLATLTTEQNIKVSQDQDGWEVKYSEAQEKVISQSSETQEEVDSQSSEVQEEVDSQREQLHEETAGYTESSQDMGKTSEENTDGENEEEGSNQSSESGDSSEYKENAKKEDSESLDEDEHETEEVNSDDPSSSKSVDEEDDERDDSSSSGTDDSNDDDDDVNCDDADGDSDDKASDRSAEGSYDYIYSNPTESVRKSTPYTSSRIISQSNARYPALDIDPRYSSHMGGQRNLRGSSRYMSTYSSEVDPSFALRGYNQQNIEGEQSYYSHNSSGSSQLSYPYPPYSSHNSMHMQEYKPQSEITDRPDFNPLFNPGSLIYEAWTKKVVPKPSRAPGPFVQINPITDQKNFYYVNRKIRTEIENSRRYKPASSPGFPDPSAPSPPFENMSTQSYISAHSGGRARANPQSSSRAILQRRFKLPHNPVRTNSDISLQVRFSNTNSSLSPTRTTHPASYHPNQH